MMEIEGWQIIAQIAGEITSVGLLLAWIWTLRKDYQDLWAWVRHIVNDERTDDEKSSGEKPGR